MNYSLQYIDKDQHLCDIWSAIPSNIILSKTLTGIGATTLEIESHRNSIIIEPNVPVIQGKMKKFNTKSKMLIRGVYEGVTEDQILDYIESNVEFKKFIVTPESFRRVKDALLSSGIDMYEEYFMLFDECERAIQDVNYRATVILPMLDFFKFANKAFISATPIIPSDPRFARHKFKSILIAPTFDYKRDMKLIITDYTLLSLKKFIDENPRERYFIFVKSTEQIAKIIKSLNLTKDSAIFCAKDSKEKLKANDFTHVSTTLGEFQKYNFFTSRFYSAVDIEYAGEPTVVIVSDIITSEHTMVDPQSEVIQIAGRFRKKLKDLVHITNLNPLLKYRTEKEVLDDIKNYHMIYKAIRRFYDGSTSLSSKQTVRQMLERVDYAKYIDWQGNRNYYMVDNTVHDEKVKSFYQNEGALITAYNGSEQFNLEIVDESYAFTELDQQKITRSTRLRDVYEIVMPILEDLYTPGKYTLYQQYFIENNIKSNHPKLMADFKRLGYDAVANLKFDPKEIKKAIARLNNKSVTEHFGLIKFISENFKEHKCYLPDDIIEILNEGLKALNLLTTTASIALLKKFCMVNRCTYQTKTKNRKEVKGYVITQLPK